MSYHSILDTINSPVDLRMMHPDQLPLLAAEIRERIIKTVARTGGHLAPSLGVVELTLALHYTFNTPVDKLIWDVGHQCYAHKLITGRREKFETLRQYKGISGFTKREESIYDVFDTGHSSTSISAGLGIALAQHLKEEKNKTIAVIGDGSMTGGIALEGLNQAGHLDKDLIVILNDNEMSISPNVGALSSFLSRKMTGRAMSRFKHDLSTFLKHFDGVGENIRQALKKSEDSLKGLLTPGMLFEALQFEYIGPLSGHRLDNLIETFSNVRDFSSGPVLIHVLTTKGKGYYPAEVNPGTYHGIGPFSLETGKPYPDTSKRTTYTKAFGDAMVSLARKEDRIAAISAAMPGGTGLELFSRTYPDRFFDVGIAEQHAVTFAAGMATQGMLPVVAIYSTFLQRAFDQILHDVCLPNLPVTFALDRGGLVGDDGPTHHGVFDFSYLRFIPNMVVMAPKDEEELQDMLYTAIFHPGPVSVRYPRGKGVGKDLKKPFEALPVGRGEILREGTDLLLLAIGTQVYPALEAAEELEQSGISTAVINARFVKPLDEELICEWSRKTGKVVTVEENVKQGGFGSAILELFWKKGLTGLPVRIVGLDDRFVEHGDQETLRRITGIDREGIVEEALDLMEGMDLRA